MPPDNLSAFLARIAAAVESIAAAWKDALDLRTTLSVEIIRLQGRLDVVETANRALVARVEVLESAHDRTGQQSVTDLREALKRAQDAQSHWTRYVVGAVVSLALAVGLLLLGRALK